MRPHYETNQDGRTRLRLGKADKPIDLVWQCLKCQTKGGKLGWTSVAEKTRFAYCPYCDEGTRQISVKEFSCP